MTSPTSTNEPIRITWSRTEADAVRAIRLHYNNLKWQKPLWYLVIPLVPVLLAIYLLAFGVDLLGIAYVVAYVVIVAAAALFRWVMLPRHARQVFRQQKALHQPLTQEIDERGLGEQRGDDNRTFLPWDAVHRTIEGPDEFMIYQSEALYHMIPKRELTPEESQRVRAILSNRAKLG